MTLLSGILWELCFFEGAYRRETDYSLSIFFKFATGLRYIFAFYLAIILLFALVNFEGENWPKFSTFTIEIWHLEL